MAGPNVFKDNCGPGAKAGPGDRELSSIAISLAACQQRIARMDVVIRFPLPGASADDIVRTAGPAHEVTINHGHHRPLRFETLEQLHPRFAWTPGAARLPGTQCPNVF